MKKINEENNKNNKKEGKRIYFNQNEKKFLKEILN